MPPCRVAHAALATALALPLAAVLARPVAAGQTPPNILVIVADDLGVDRVASYGEHPDPGHTPVIDALAAEGVLFRNAWANPVCGPSRAAMLTGRAASTTGYGWGWAYNGSPDELPLAEVTLAEVLAPGHRTAAVGKWHLASGLLSGAAHPNLQGFEHFRGSMGILSGFIGNGYFDWQKVEDGVYSHSTTYATTETVDDALELIAGFGSDPWFLWVAFHAPHSPFHKPPPGLHSQPLPADVAASIPLHAQAAIEAMDTEIGRLLGSLDPPTRAATIVVFVGDNGTDGPATTAPFVPAHAKGTVYEGGANVPLIISGPGVASGAECAGLVHATDLFATLAELAGARQDTGVDSISLVPYLSQPGRASLRSAVRTEIFQPNGPGAYQFRQRAARNTRFKLIYLYQNAALPTEVLFFDLLADPWETDNLLDGPLTPTQQGAYDRLALELEEAHVPWLALGYGVPGVAGTPQLAGQGSLLGSAPFTLTLTGAAPAATAVLVIGTLNLGLAFSGGIFVPSPDFLFFLTTDAQGGVQASAPWPPGVPSGLSLMFQYWISDAAAIYGLASSNGIAATTP